MTKAYYFWFGFLFHICTVGIAQDIVGKEKYLMLEAETWINTKVWYWFMFLAIYTACGLGLEYLDIKLKMWNNKIDKIKKELDE